MPEFRFAALKLCGICILVFTSAQVFPDFFYGNFTLVSSDVFVRPWIIITHIFMHASIVHLLSNMFALALFGSILEKYIGWRNLIYVFFTAGIISSFADILFYDTTLGASGAIFGVMGCLAALRPKQIVWVMGVPMYIIIAAFIWASLDMMGMFYPDNVAHAAHLYGLGSGMILGLWLRKRFPPPKRRKEPKIEITEESLRRFEDTYMR